MLNVMVRRTPPAFRITDAYMDSKSAALSCSILHSLLGLALWGLNNQRLAPESFSGLQTLGEPIYQCPS